MAADFVKEKVLIVDVKLISLQDRSKASKENIFGVGQKKSFFVERWYKKFSFFNILPSTSF